MGILWKQSDITILAIEIICGEFVALFETEETEFNKLAVGSCLVRHVCIRRVRMGAVPIGGGGKQILSTHVETCPLPPLSLDGPVSFLGSPDRTWH